MTAAACEGVELVTDMGRLIDRVFEDIDRAGRRVWVEGYIFRDDKLGTQLAEHLVRARARGVDVRLLFDGLGSKDTPREFFQRLRAAGVKALRYRALGPSLMSGAVFPRDHGRVIVADDCAWAGGFAWGDEWLPRERGGEGWEDAGVRLEGDCVEDFARVFRIRWREARKPSREPEEDATESEHGDVELVADVPSDENAVLDRHIERICSARQRVWIENAYFFPPRRIRKCLGDAAARGVDVRIILPRKSDNRWTEWAARAEYELWLSMGMRLYEFGPTMMHGKVALVDDDWATVGSFNINVVTSRFASEVNVFVERPGFVRQLAEHFERHFAASQEIHEGWIQQHPLHLRAAWQLTRWLGRVIEILVSRWATPAAPALDANRQRPAPASK